MVRRVGPAAVHERALVRLEAVQPDRHIGERPREHLPLAVNLVRDSGEKRYDRSRDVGALEQITRVGISELLVQVQHRGRRDLHPAGRGHASLDRDVGDVLVFLRAGRLDLGEVVPVALLLEHVDRDEGIVGNERRLEDRRSPRVEQFSRRGDAPGAGVARQVDQHTAWIARTRHFAYLVALIK